MKIFYILIILIISNLTSANDSLNLKNLSNSKQENGLLQVKGNCGSAKILIDGIKSIHDSFYVSDIMEGNIVITNSINKTRIINSDNFLYEYVGVSCSLSRKMKNVLVIWTQSSGTASTDEYMYYVIDVNNLSLLLPKKQDNYCSLECVNKFLKNKLSSPY